MTEVDMRTLALALSCAGLLAAVVGGQQPGGSAKAATTMDRIAEDFVKLVLAVGQHDADYVDAYYGPPEWKKASDAARVPLESLAAKAAELLSAANAERAPSEEMS